MNDMLKIHFPYKMFKNKLKFQEKPWISSGLQKSISIKNSVFKKYINNKNQHIKKEFNRKYKNYRNVIATLMKKSNQNYFAKYLNLISKTLKAHARELKYHIIKKFCLKLTQSFKFQ